MSAAAIVTGGGLTRFGSLPAVGELNVAVSGGEIDPPVRDNDGPDHTFADVPAGVGQCAGRGRGNLLTVRAGHLDGQFFLIAVRSAGEPP